MKRLVLLLGPVIAIVGSLGLVMFGSAFVGVFFAVLTFRIVDPPQPLPAALAELQWAVMSAMAIVVGVAVSCVAMVKRNNRQTISTTGRLLYAAAGVSLIGGTIPLAWGIMDANQSFRNIARSASSPTAESVQEMIHSVEPAMTIGFAMLVLSAVLLLAASLVEFQVKTSPANGTRAPLNNVVAIGSVLVSVILFPLLISVGLNGIALETILTETSMTPNPAELAAHLAGILNKSLLVFAGLGTLGLLQLLAAIYLPLARPDADPEI